mgnify:FL=1
MTVYEWIGAAGVIAAALLSFSGWLRTRGRDGGETVRQQVLLETIRDSVEEIRLDTKALRRDYTDLCVRVARLEEHKGGGNHAANDS